MSSDFRTRTLRRALDATMTAAMQPGKGKREAMRAAARQVSYQWRLREVMAAHGLFNATDLVPLLAERGITLSSVKVWRLVNPDPRTAVPARPRRPLRHLRVTAEQLIATTARSTPARKTAASGSGDDVTDLNAIRPRRAQLRRQP